MHKLCTSASEIFFGLVLRSSFIILFRRLLLWFLIVFLSQIGFKNLTVLSKSEFFSNIYTCTILEGYIVHSLDSNRIQDSGSTYPSFIVFVLIFVIVSAYECSSLWSQFSCTVPLYMYWITICPGSSYPTQNIESNYSIQLSWCDLELFLLCKRIIFTLKYRI